MVTFSLQSGRTGNFYRGHEPSSGNCWGDEDNALVLSIEQARALNSAWLGCRFKIVVSTKAEQTHAEYSGEFEHELFCTAGGDWFVFPHRKRLATMLKCDHSHGNECKHCGASYHGGADGYWYDSITGRELCEELRI